MNFISRDKTSPEAKSPHVRRIRDIVRELIANDQANVMVTELACREEGCPPIETVIVVADAQNKTVKIGKKIQEITLEDLTEVFLKGKDHSH